MRYQYSPTADRNWRASSSISMLVNAARKRRTLPSWHHHLRSHLWTVCANPWRPWRYLISRFLWTRASIKHEKASAGHRQEGPEPLSRSGCSLTCSTLSIVARQTTEATDQTAGYSPTNCHGPSIRGTSSIASIPLGQFASAQARILKFCVILSLESSLGPFTAQLFTKRLQQMVTAKI